MSPALLASDNPLNHVVQHPLIQFGNDPWGFTLLSNHIIMQLIAAGLLIFFLPRFVRRRAGTDEVGRLVPKGWGNAIEGVCEVLRTHVARPVLGDQTDRFIPFVWSAFFFIYTCNLLGMIPLSSWTPFLGGGHVLGGTSTGNIFVTAALAVCTLFMIVYNGLRLHGMGYVKHFFIGPAYLSWFIAILEVLGLGIKIFALAMRLFANMVGGHILLAVLLSFVGMAIGELGTTGGLLVAVPVVLGSIALNFLELFVATLQAFIFTFLSTVFIGQAINIHHDHEEHDEHPAAEAAGS